MKSKYWIGLLALVLAVSLGLSVYLMSGSGPASHAQILVDGELEHTVSLHTDREFVISSPKGTNTVTVQDGMIAVTSADCPDQYCVKQGFCNSGVDIVCLPHGLVIRFVDDGGVDGAVG